MNAIGEQEEAQYQRPSSIDHLSGLLVATQLMLVTVLLVATQLMRASWPRVYVYLNLIESPSMSFARTS